MPSNGRNGVAAAALFGYFVAYAAAGSLIVLNAGLVLAALVRYGNLGNPDHPSWFAYGIALLVAGVPVGLASAWCAYRSRFAHVSAISLGVVASILCGILGARFLTAANSAGILGWGVGYTILGMMLWSLAAAGGAAVLGGTLGLMLEWLRISMSRESTTEVSR